MENAPIPPQVIQVLETANIGYLTTVSKKGDLYSYPVAFYYSDLRVYFVTPAGAAKYKMIKEHPTVSLIVDNRQLTTNACGAMIQGKAKPYSVTRTILSILSLGPKVSAFSKKYPGMLTFYAKGKGLPEERKLYKYRIIQINPTKILYWIGYNFGRYNPQIEKSSARRLGLEGKVKDAAGLSHLFSTADEEPFLTEPSVDHEWLVRLNKEVSAGHLTRDERSIITSYKRAGTASTKLTDDEKQLLEKWKRTQPPNL